MADIVNLRIARKRATRAQAESTAAQRRVDHGVRKPERDRLALEQERVQRAADGHRLDERDEPEDRR